MSQADAKASSTRLPPRVAPSKQPTQSKKVLRKMAEREAAEKEELNEKVTSSSERLVEVLSTGGVAEPVLQRLGQGLSFKEEDTKVWLVEADAALSQAWSLASCYPSIDVNALVAVLDELRALLCDSAALAKRPVHRKLESVRSDPKADPEVLEAAEKSDAEVSEIETKCNISAYKTRALQRVVAV